jgi:hypothetical protein
VVQIKVAPLFDIVGKWKGCAGGGVGEELALFSFGAF